MKKHSLLVWRQYIYLLASNPHTIVMLWSMEPHITFCHLYHLIHLTSIGDAAALLWSNGYCHMISGGGWWEWGNIQCTVGAYSWPGDEWSRSSVLERAYCPTSAQCPQVGAFGFCFHIFFRIWNMNSRTLPLQMEGVFEQRSTLPYHLSNVEMDDDEAKYFGHQTNVLRPFNFQRRKVCKPHWEKLPL